MQRIVPLGERTLTAFWIPTDITYMTAPHVQTSKRKRRQRLIFTPYAMFRPYSGTGLLCAIFGETPARKTSDLRVTQDMLARNL